jgi:hypothetical protein
MRKQELLRQLVRGKQAADVFKDQPEAQPHLVAWDMALASYYQGLQPKDLRVRLEVYRSLQARASSMSEAAAQGDLTGFLKHSREMLLALPGDATPLLSALPGDPTIPPPPPRRTRISG